MKWIRTPPDIWQMLTQEFDFTVDVCASDDNHLLPRYYTRETDGLKQDWSGEVAYIHPMFDGKINKFVQKAAQTPSFTGVFFIPAATGTKYFHEHIYQNPNVEIRFLRNPKRGYHFGHEDGTWGDPNSVGYIKPMMIVIFRNP
jgi:phage N-6-adenine-methyltransferase